jgi:anti-sigma factor RsiW
MKCSELQSLAGPYLDSELDAKTSLEIQQHLAACPACARRLAAEQQFAARLTTVLRRGETTPELWRNTEALVRAAARNNVTRAGRERPAESWWRAWLWPNPQFYAGAAALWVLMLAVHFIYLGEPVRARAAATPPSPEVQSALAEQRRELAELLGTVGPSGATPTPRNKSLSPRRESRKLPEKPGETMYRPAASESFPA